jgi:MFS family permease
MNREAEMTRMALENDRSALRASGKWMALTAALLGWMFDGFEMGMFPLIGQPALAELLQPVVPDGAKAEHVEQIKSAAAAAARQWFGVIMATFLVGAATGGVLFGWLGDRIGRVRAMSLSIFTYAIFTGLCGFATAAWQIAILRFIASLGMGGEWSLGVALVIEIWPDKSRAFLAGLIGAAANVGFLLVGVLSLSLLALLDGASDFLLGVGMSSETTGRLLANQGWRLLMMAGAVPALLIFFIRLCVPESARWEHERREGRTSHWATADLLGVLAGCFFGAGLVVYLWSPLAKPRVLAATPILIAATLVGVAVALIGYIFPVLRYLLRAEEAGSIPAGSTRPNVGRLLLGAALTGVALLGTWGALQWAPRWASQLAPDPARYAKEYTQIASAGGAIAGTIAAALLGGWLGRRITYTLLCIGSLGSALLLYQTNTVFGSWFLVCVAVAGGVTASFYGWFPLYLPELFRTSVRATSQGFAFNFGRIIAAIGTLQTATLMKAFDDSFPKAGSVLCAVYLVGVLVIWFGPETKGSPLPE